MSRIGKKVIPVPSGVTVSVDGQAVSVKGPKGELNVVLVDDVIAKLETGGIQVNMRKDTRRGRSMWGLSRTVVANLIDGVSQGFSRSLEITGVGYRAAVEGKKLKLALGFSHDVLYPIPEDVVIACPKPTEITVTGIDRQRVGQVAAEIRHYRPPEPYKGKGVRFAGEYIFRKEGKKK
jgi:large subunit ribosomal protein L6